MTRRRLLLSILVVALALLIAPAALLHGGRQAAAAATGAAALAKPITTVTEVNLGSTKTLYESGQFKVTGSCLNNGGGDYTAQAYLSTKKDNANYFISDTGTPVLDFDKVDGPVAFDHYGANGTTADFVAWDYYDEVYAESANGKVLIARVATTVHVLGADCTFSGLFLDEGSGTPTRGVKAVALGATTTLFENDQFRVTGTCVNNGGGDYTARAFLATKKNNALYYLTQTPTSVLDFDKADPAVAFDFTSATGTTPDFEGYDYNSEVSALSSKGQVLIARVASGVHIHGAACTFSGLFLDDNSGPVRNQMKVGVGATKTLFENNQFRVTGTCVNNGGGSFTASARIATKDDNAHYFISKDAGPVLDFDVADGAMDFNHGDQASGFGPDFEFRDYDAEVYIESSHGQVLIARIASGVHIQGADCIFAGLLQDGN